MTMRSDFHAVLTDLADGVWLERFELSAKSGLELRGSPDWSIAKRTLRGGMSDGVDVIVLNNGALSVSVLPTRGMGLWRGSYRGIALGWNSPVAFPVHPAFVNLTLRDGLGWLAGFNEWMCRCGLSSHGAPGVDVIRDEAGNESRTTLTLHGAIANLPAHHVSVGVSREGEGTLSVIGVVDEATLFGPNLRLKTTVSTEAGSNRLKIRDEITNRSATAAEFEILYHTNFGAPLLEEGAEIVAAVRKAEPRDARAAEGQQTWQRFGGPQAGYTEQCYFLDLAADATGGTAVLLRNAHGDHGCSLHFNVRQLPCFTLWKNTQPEADGYVAGLEPGTSLPNLKTREREAGRLVNLAAGATYTIEWEIAVHSSIDEVRAVAEQIARLPS